MNAAILAREAAEMVQRPDFLLATGVLVATLLLGAFILSRVERWRKRQLSDSPASDIERFSSFRAMYENGELSKEEYDRIKAREAQRLLRKTAPAPASPSADSQLPANPGQFGSEKKEQPD